MLLYTTVTNAFCQIVFFPSRIFKTFHHFLLRSHALLIPLDACVASPHASLCFLKHSLTPSGSEEPPTQALVTALSSTKISSVIIGV